MNPHDYRAYGLSIRSEIPLPFLPGDAEPAPDVAIRFGEVPPALPAPADAFGTWQTGPGVFLLNVDGVARYLATDGRAIAIDPAGGSEHDIVVFLVGSVLGALLHQRGILPLHASAVETDAGAVLFLGQSGAGKSTLLAALLDRGYAMLADDVAGVVLAGGRPAALSAFPGTRLWTSALDALDWREHTHGRVREGMEKYLVPVEQFRTAPQAVRAAYVLRSHNREGIELEAMNVSTAFGSLVRHTYRRKFPRGLGRQASHFRLATTVAKQVPVARVTRPSHPVRLTALADRIETHLHDTPSMAAVG